MKQKSIGKNYLGDEIGVSNIIDVIRCGINFDKFDSQRKSKTDGRVKMLTIARLVEKKGRVSVKSASYGNKRDT